MHRPPLTLLLLAAISTLTVSSLAAQARPSPAESADAARLRTEKAVARQKKAVVAMSGSLAGQQVSVERQRRNTHPVGLFEFQPAQSFNPVATALSCDSLPPDEIDALVDNAAARTSVSPQLIRSVMRQESAFHACAVSAKGAVGLMQLLPATASELGVRDAFDPEANVLGGATLLKQLMDRYGGDLSLTLSAYNAGPGRVDAAMGIPMIPETMDYVKKILSHLPVLSSQPAGEKENTETDGQATRDSPASISFWLTGADGGK